MSPFPPVALKSMRVSWSSLATSTWKKTNAWSGSLLQPAIADESTSAATKNDERVFTSFPWIETGRSTRRADVVATVDARRNMAWDPVRGGEHRRRATDNGRGHPRPKPPMPGDGRRLGG